MQFPKTINYTIINPSPRNVNQSCYITQIITLPSQSYRQTSQPIQFQKCAQTSGFQKYNSQLNSNQSSEDENSKPDQQQVIKLIKENQELKAKILEKEKQLEFFSGQLQQYEKQ